MSNILTFASIIMLVLLFLKTPVYIAILGGSMVYFVLAPDVNPIMFAQRAITGTESVNLLAIPFFVCAGVLMNYTGVTKRIMTFCAVLTGRMHGGLAQVNVLLSTLMGGLSGSNIADAAMQSKMLVPEMEKKGFSKEFSSVVTATSSMITPLIPPGIAMILYGILTGVSIGQLFVSGIGVGLLLCVSLMILVRFISARRGYAPIRAEKTTVREFGAALKPAFFPLCLPIIIIGGIRMGIFTATESGSIAVVYAVALGLFYRELPRSALVKGLRETVGTTTSIMLIVAAASVFSWILTREQIPQQLTQWIITAFPNRLAFLIAVNIFLLLVGMFIEGNASMIVLVPLLHPVAMAYGIDPIHFAMMYIFNAAIGALSPPMGVLMFVVCGITGCKTANFIREAVPFYLFLLVDLMLLTFVPFLTTGLVRLIF
jgi:tripartite ATP-independent transporter DctM subunit